MKTDINSQKGNTLIVALLAIIILSGASAAFLSISTYRTREAVNSHNYTRAFYIADSGVSISMAELTAEHDYDSDGLANVTGNVDEGQYDVSAVDHGDDVWTLTSTGTVESLSRGIEVVVRRQVENPYDKAAFGGTALNMGGQGFVDSYDTDVGDYASQATNIDPLTGLPYANSNGSVGTNGDVNALGQVAIYGDATPGPGGTVITGTQTTISGSTTPAAEERVLETYPYDPPIPSSGPLVLGGHSSQTLAAGTYRFDYMILSAFGHLTLGQNSGDVLTIYVDGVISVTGGGAQITVANGASARILHGGGDEGKTDVVNDPDINLAGVGVTNTSEIPGNLIIITASDGLINLAGQADFHGVIYAPSATINFAGQADVFGSLTGNTVDISGQGNLHYDEALGRLHIGEFFPYRVRS